jgi:hypothetical protein
MATRPTQPQRWPRGAEATRRRAIEEATDAGDLLDEARRELRRNPLLAELQISDAQQRIERIRRLLAEARLGAEAPAPPEGDDDG